MGTDSLTAANSVEDYRAQLAVHSVGGIELAGKPVRRCLLVFRVRKDDSRFVKSGMAQLVTEDPSANELVELLTVEHYTSKPMEHLPGSAINLKNVGTHENPLAEFADIAFSECDETRHEETESPLRRWRRTQDEVCC